MYFLIKYFNSCVVCVIVSYIYVKWTQSHLWGNTSKDIVGEGSTYWRPLSNQRPKTSGAEIQRRAKMKTKVYQDWYGKVGHQRFLEVITWAWQHFIAHLFEGNKFRNIWLNFFYKSFDLMEGLRCWLVHGHVDSRDQEHGQCGAPRR